jgi:MFS family permease
VSVVVAEPPAPATDTATQRITLSALVLVITVVAAEAMAVATAMPTVARSLHGLHVFGWAFTAFLLADIVGMVDAGSRADRTGPRTPLVGGLALFAIGLVVAGLAPDITVFLAGRVLQGLGSGSVIVAVYVVVARVFPEPRRPKVFAAMSGAWVVPALVGPAVAGFVTDTVGWRWVFLGMAPLALVGAVLLVPVLRHTGGGTPGVVRRVGTTGGAALAVGLALIQAAGQRLDVWSLPAVLAGVALTAWPLPRVLPAGALRLRPGLPTLVLLRGVCSAAFFGAEAYVPLTLTRIHGASPTVVGIPLTLGALGWSAASWWQGRVAGNVAPDRLLRAGFVCVGAGVASLVSVSLSGVSMWAAAGCWALAGFGMGLGYPTISVHTLRLSPPGEQGANSAAMQVADMTGSILGVALAATLVNSFGGAHFAGAVRLADPLLAAVALSGILLAGRALTRPIPPYGASRPAIPPYGA